MRSKHWLLIALAIIAFLVTLLLFLPASLIANWLPANVTTGTLSGTLWNGSADALSVDGRLLGAAQWRARPLQLLRGRLAADAAVMRDGGEMRGRFALGTGGKIEITDLEARWPLGDLPVRALRKGLIGDLQINAPLLQLENGAPTAAQATIDLRNLRERGADVGSYRVTFDDSSRQGAQLVGRMQDLGGPVQVTGTITLGPGRSYVIDGLVAARPDAPAQLVENLRYLGDPDAQGRRPFSESGTY